MHRWLVGKDRNEEALLVLKKVRGLSSKQSSADACQELKEIQESIHILSKNKIGPLLGELYRVKYRYVLHNYTRV